VLPYCSCVIFFSLFFYFFHSNIVDHRIYILFSYPFCSQFLSVIHVILDRSPSCFVHTNGQVFCSPYVIEIYLSKHHKADKNFWFIFTFIVQLSILVKIQFQFLETLFLFILHPSLICLSICCHREKKRALLKIPYEHCIRTYNSNWYVLPSVTRGIFDEQ
jgi:hypothetical protein